MTDDNKAACAAMLDWLEKRHAAIMDCEKEAYACMDAGDIDAYRSKMREKAENLSAIARDAEKCLRPCRQNWAMAWPTGLRPLRAARVKPWSWIPFFICPPCCILISENLASRTT